MIRRLVKVVLPLAILAGAVLGAWGLWNTRAQVEPQPAEERVWTVAAAPAARVEARPEMRLFGEIVAGREVELRPLVAGRIVEVGPNFVEGGVMRADELVVAVDPFDYQADVAEYEARIAESRARLSEIGAELESAKELLEHDREQMELAKHDVERRDKLRDTAAVSQKALDDARMALSQREQQVISRKETIKRLAAQGEQQEAVVRRWEVALARARRDLEETRLTAPFDGFLIDTDAAIGKRVGTADRIARLIDAGRLEVRFHLSDSEFARLLAVDGYRGRAARVIWRIGAQEFAFDAEIDRLEGEIDPESGGIDLFARIDGAGVEGVLRPGAFVEVRVHDRVYRNVVRLPESALHDGDKVFVVVDGRLSPRAVEVVVRSSADVLVRGALAPEDRVVTTRFPEIGPGVRVTVP